jgi:hypothetical protein
MFESHTDKLILKQLQSIEAKQDQILAALNVSIKQEKTDMAAIDDTITSLTAQVAANTTVIGSATVLISGFKAQLAAAVAAAQAAGATPAQLKSLTDLSATIQANDTPLAAAVAANTPAA